MREALNSAILTKPKFLYSQMIKAGPNYVTSAMVALDNDTGKLVSGGSADQTRKILQNLALLMQEFGLGWNDMVSARIYSTRFAEFPDINRAWEEVFSATHIVPPARSAFGVSDLPLQAAVAMEFSFYREA